MFPKLPLHTHKGTISTPEVNATCESVVGKSSACTRGVESSQNLLPGPSSAARPLPCRHQRASPRLRWSKSEGGCASRWAEGSRKGSLPRVWLVGLLALALSGLAAASPTRTADSPNCTWCHRLMLVPSGASARFLGRLATAHSASHDGSFQSGATVRALGKKVSSVSSHASRC